MHVQSQGILVENVFFTEKLTDPSVLSICLQTRSDDIITLW